MLRGEDCRGKRTFFSKKKLTLHIGSELLTESSSAAHSRGNRRRDLWIVLATQSFLLVALAFWYGTYLVSPSAYFWMIPGVVAGSIFLLFYGRSLRKIAQKSKVL